MSEDFTFSQIVFESVGTPLSQQACTHRNAAFSTQDKKVFRNYKALVSAATASQVSFSPHAGPYARFIRLATAAAVGQARQVPVLLSRRECSEGSWHRPTKQGIRQNLEVAFYWIYRKDEWLRWRRPASCCLRQVLTPPSSAPHLQSRFAGDTDFHLW